MKYEDGLQLIIDKVEGVSEKSWQDIVDDLGLKMNKNTLRNAVNVGPYSGYNVAMYYKAKTMENSTEAELEEIRVAKEELKKEKMKVQTLNLDYNKNLRSDARQELFHEMIVDAIDRLKPIETKVYTKSKSIDKTALLNIADIHYGQEIKLEAFNGEIVNEYSTDIFEARMWHLMAQMKANLDYDKLVIFGLGDFIQGILRLTDIQKCSVSVVDATIKLSEFLSTWLDTLQRELNVPIEMQMVGGNHDAIRLLTGKKGDFPDDTVDKLIYEFMRLRLLNNENIKLTLSKGVVFYSFYGINIMGDHGEGDLKKSIAFYEDYYGVDCDIFIAGHLHRSSQETIGVAEIGDKQVVRVPSIVGACEYSKKLKRSSRAGCKFYVFSEDGIEYEKIYYLN
ncbi:MAG: hypothetical protein ACRDDY_07395 [Clostridium sp.]|uniref:hypothetical protein n=1 Tax=Clostridium sp. TaxID=1506 RepID=UPI003EE79CEF